MGNAELWPKGRIFAVPGPLTIHVGPVQSPAPIEVVYANYKKWVETINPHAFADRVKIDTASHETVAHFV
jgi:hypothetical protein